MRVNNNFINCVILVFIMLDYYFLFKAFKIVLFTVNLRHIQILIQKQKHWTLKRTTLFVHQWTQSPKNSLSLFSYVVHHHHHHNHIIRDRMYEASTRIPFNPFIMIIDWRMNNPFSSFLLAFLSLFSYMSFVYVTL